MKINILIILISSVLLNSCMTTQNQIDAEDVARNYLLESISDSTLFWNKIHAIEFLIDLGYIEEIRSIMNILGDNYENTPQKRIGFWRCMSKIETNSDIKNRYIDKILNVYLDPESPDRIHAAESLAKMSVSLKNHPQPVLQSDSKNNSLKAYINWSSVYPETSDSCIDYSVLIKTLDSDNSDYKRIMAYGLKFLGKIKREQWENIAEKAIKQPNDYPFSTYLLCGALSTCPDNARKSSQACLLRNKLKILAKDNNPTNQYEAYISLGNFGCPDDLIFIREEFLKLYSRMDSMQTNNNTKDVLSSISFALLKIAEKNKEDEFFNL